MNLPKPIVLEDVYTYGVLKLYSPGTSSLIAYPGVNLRMYAPYKIVKSKKDLLKLVLQSTAPLSGYICVPYMHDHDSIELKEDWVHSSEIKDVYFVTATFSSESRPYFAPPTSHYLLARFRNSKRILSLITRHTERTLLVLSIDEDLFEREANDEVNFISVYYLEYGDSDEDIGEVASVVARRERVGKAGIGHMDVCSLEPQKFTFPYSNNIVVLEVSSEKSHQSMNKYCEKTRREVSRKGITMTNLVSLSILEKMK